MELLLCGENRFNLFHQDLVRDQIWCRSCMLKLWDLCSTVRSPLVEVQKSLSILRSDAISLFSSILQHHAYMEWIEAAFVVLTNMPSDFNILSPKPLQLAYSELLLSLLAMSLNISHEIFLRVVTIVNSTLTIIFRKCSFADLNLYDAKVCRSTISILQFLTFFRWP